MSGADFDWLGFLLSYTAARLGLLLMLILLGAFSGEILFPSIATFLPYSALPFKEFIINEYVRSALGTLVMLIFLVWIFYDDGRKHTAYENWSITNILTCLILIFMVYFVPAIFRDSFHKEGKADIFYKVLYYPAHWVSAFMENYLMDIVFASAVILGTAYAAYFLAYKNYIKRHPVLLEKRSLAQAASELSEENADDDDNLDDFFN